MERRCQTLVVGGGISGLACAAHLHDADASDEGVIVLEADPRPGGKMQSTRRDGFLLERGPTTVLDNVPETHALVRLAGLENEWLAASAVNRHRYLWKQGARHRLPAPPHALWEALTTPVLSPRGKLRFAMEPFMPRRDNHGESLRAFARRRIGPEATTSLIEPFACGIHAGDPARLEVASAFPKLARAERDYGNLMPGMFRLARARRAGAPGRPTRMRSFAEGLGRLPEALAMRLGAAYVGACTVDRIVPAGTGYTAHARRGEQSFVVHAQRLVLAVPSHVAAALLRPCPDARELSDELGAIESNRIALVHVGVRARDVPATLDGFGHLVVRDHGVRTLGTIYASSLFEGRTPSDDEALLTCFTGGTLDEAVLDMTDAAIADFVLEDLHRTLGYAGTPRCVEVIRWPRAFPRYHLGHADRVARMRRALTRLPGLYLAGNYVQGLSVNDCIRCGTDVARMIVDEDRAAR